MLQLIRFEFKQLFASWLFYSFLLCTIFISIFFFKTTSLTYTYTTTINSYMGVYTLFAPVVAISIFFLSYLFLIIFLRDSNSNFDKILFSLPIKNRNLILSKYIIGSFQALLFIGVILISFNIFIDYFLNDSIKVQYNQWSVYTSYIFYILLPNLFFSVSLILFIASKTKDVLKTLIVYIIITTIILLPSILFDQLGFNFLASILDFNGDKAIIELTQYWSKLDQSIYNPYNQTPLFINRIITIITSIALSYLTIIGIRSQKSTGSESSNEYSNFKSTFTKTLTLNHSYIWFTQQFISQIKIDISAITLTKWFWQTLITVFIGGIFLCNEIESAFGAVALKSSYSIYTQLAMIAINVLPWLSIIFTGLLLSNEKNNNVFFLIKSSNNSSMTWLLSKWVSASLVITLFSITLLISGITSQLFSGQIDIDWRLYSFGFIFYLTSKAILFSGVTIFFHVLIRNTIISMILVIALSALWDKYVFFADFMSAPNLDYSTLNGWSGNIIGWLWFNIMWLAIAVTLVVIVKPLVKIDFLNQFKIHNVFSNPKRSLNHLLVVLVLTGLSSLLVIKNYNNEALQYNGFALNKNMFFRSEYEKKHKTNIKNDAISITNWNGNIDLYANNRSLEVNASITFKNVSNENINEFLLFWNENTKSVSVNVLNDNLQATTDEFNVTTLTLNEAIPPNESFTVNYKFKYSPSKYSFAYYDNRLIKNGTFLNNNLFTPNLEVNEGMFITSLKGRKKYNLGDLDLSYDSVKLDRTRSSFHGKSNKIHFNFIVSSDTSQQVTMPGVLIKKWQENNRQYFHYQPKKPISNFASLTSGKYKVKSSKWNNVDLQVQYNPNHDVNIDTIFQSMQDSLSYYDQYFSPYQNDYLRIIETAEFHEFAQSFIGTVPFSNTMGFNSANNQQNSVNLAYFVTAHEIAHQWWGHQLTPAKTLGSQFLSEALSQYSAYQVVRNHLGKNQTRLLNKNAQDNFLKSLTRLSQSGSREGILLKPGIKSSYLYYSKSIFNLAQIAYMIGEENFNLTLKELIELHGNREDNFAAPIDFEKLLRKQTPAIYKAGVRKTLNNRLRYDNRIVSVDTKQLSDGQYQSIIEFESHAKSYTDQSEREELINYPIELALFAQHPDKSESTWEDNLLTSHRIEMNKGDASHESVQLTIQGTNIAKITILTDKKPNWIAIDPEYLYLDRNLDDNFMKVK